MACNLNLDIVRATRKVCCSSALPAIALIAFVRICAIFCDPNVAVCAICRRMTPAFSDSFVAAVRQPEAAHVQCVSTHFCRLHPCCALLLEFFLQRTLSA